MIKLSMLQDTKVDLSMTKYDYEAFILKMKVHMRNNKNN